ncbi:hypothetical protein DSO57_1037331 [Entomophthora muscae]|uniref:Uncharacterized protein n=1 Tax=Entomophthora muscae TaxID=34485 RepID=A0ACC2S0Z4_9FUNG|nr:hypothetical protein DSO57_1037331 [Entomophthora muscae]
MPVGFFLGARARPEMTLCRSWDNGNQWISPKVTQVERYQRKRQLKKLTNIGDAAAMGRYSQNGNN